MADLPTNLKDDILDSSVNTRRKYRMIENGDGTYSFEDATEYSQVGDEYGAGLINETNKQVNARVEKAVVVRDLDTIGAITQQGFIPDALALKDVNDSLKEKGSFNLLCSVTETKTITVESLSQYKALAIYGDIVNPMSKIRGLGIVPIQFLAEIKDFTARAYIDGTNNCACVINYVSDTQFTATPVEASKIIKVYGIK